MLRALAIVTAILTNLHSYVFAQPTCLSGNNATALYNSLGQSPCAIAQALEGTCGDTPFPPLPSGDVYTVTNYDSCHCSTVFYSLISACASCQNGDYLNWLDYTVNCTATYDRVFINPIPTSIVVPHYAYLDVVASNIFNVTAAESAGGPESSPVPRSTSLSISISTTTVTATATATPTSVAAKSNPGAIAGGVVGGVAFIGIVTFLLFKLRGRKRPAPTPYTNTAVTAVSTPGRDGT